MRFIAELAVDSAGLLFVLAAILIALHYKRRGLPWYTGFASFTFPFRHLTKREWFIYLGLVGSGATLAAVGVLLMREASRAI